MNTSSVVFLLFLALASCFPAEALTATAAKRRSHSHKKLRAVHARGDEDTKVTDDNDSDEEGDASDDDEEDDDDQEVENKHAEEEKALLARVEAAKAALQKSQEEQHYLQVEVDHMNDEKASDREIDAHAKLVANETESQALANMMGSMWKEMRMFEAPAFSKHAKADIADMKKSEIELKADLEKAESQLQAARKQWASEEKDEGKKGKKEEKAAEKKEKTDSHKQEVKKPDIDEAEDAIDVKVPKLETPELFPIPTTSRCIVIMVCQYMIIYTALALCRTYHEISGRPKGKLEAGLRAAAQTLTYAPMLCVLFIACRMRVEFLSDGKGQPQMWVQYCMYALTCAVLASTLLVLFMPMVTGKPLALKDGSGDLEAPSSQEYGNKKNLFYALTGARYLILLGLYGGLAGVIVGICTYMPPGVTDLSKVPNPAPAVMCTMILAVAFFFTQLVIAICRTYSEFTRIEFPKIVGMMIAAANTVEFAPQLAILFLAARMRALQHGDQPQAWAQDCMYAATAALIVTAVLACVVPLVMGGTAKTNPVTKETTFEVPNPMIGYVLVAVRFFCMLGFYGGAVGVAYSIFDFEASKGPTQPVSPTVVCVVSLTCQFFVVYLLQTIMLTVSEVSGGRVQMDKYRLFTAVDAAKSTLGFAPMLSILFVTTRMYALLITDKKGSPQAWVQDGMYMATWSLFISFLTCLVTGLVMDKVETDEDGNVMNKFSNKYAHYAMLVVRYLSMLMLYGGITMVIVGLFVMTPETANGAGSVPIVSDVVNNTPVGNPPPSAHDVASAGKDLGDGAGHVMGEK